MTGKLFKADSLFGSVNVSDAVPADTPITVTLAPDTATSATPGSEDAAVYVRASPSQDSQRRRTSWFSVREPAHAVLNTAAWQGERRPPSNPQLPAPLDPTTEPVVGALVAKRHHPPPHSRRDADASCRRVGGHGVGRRRRRIPSCRVEAGAVRQPVYFRRERGPVGGRGGGAPRARVVRQRIGAVMKWAVAKGYRSDNPAGDAIAAAYSSMIVNIVPCGPIVFRKACYYNVIRRIRAVFTGSLLCRDVPCCTMVSPSLEREAGISLRKSLWDNDLATRYGLRVSPGVSEGCKPYYPLGLRQKRRDLEARPQHDRLPTLSGALKRPVGRVHSASRTW